MRIDTVSEPAPSSTLFWSLFWCVTGAIAAGVAMSVMVVLVRRATAANSALASAEKSVVSSLLPRAAVWIVVGYVMFIADALGTAALAVLLAVLAVQTVRELLRALSTAGAGTDPAPVIAACLVLILGAALGGSSFAVVLPITFLGTAVYFLVREPLSAAFIPRVSIAVAVTAYVGGSLATLVLLRASANGLALVIWVIMVVSLSDGTAMIGGLLFGRTRITPRLSHGKTLEGVLSGLIAGLLGAAAVRFALPGPPAAAYYCSAAVIVAAGVGGDLFASAIKRAAGIKDFGAALPGHGGMLDRLDSWLFAAPVAYALARLMFES